MTKAEAEHFYGLPGKIIDGDIQFGQKQGHPAMRVAEGLVVNNSLGWRAKLSTPWNVDDDSKVFNIHVDTEKGAICRLCVDNQPHAPCGRSHKHFVLTPTCPRNNLPSGLTDRPDLDGKSLSEIFHAFCVMIHVTHNGNFSEPIV